MNIEPQESVITGRWIVVDGDIQRDEACQRIERLTQTYLVRVASDASGWDTLFRDPADDRLWELIYPESDLHGGGPPELRCMSEQEARGKYAGV